MKKIILNSLFIFTSITLGACSVSVPLSTSTPSSTSTNELISTIQSQTMTPTHTYTPVSTFTPFPETPIAPVGTPEPTFPPELTQTPGIMETLTAFAISKTADYKTEQSNLGPLADLLSISQYFNPVGAPLKVWHDVPIMSQATAGQEFKTDIYSYRATATLAAAQSFYMQKSVLLKWVCFPGTGTAGTGSNAQRSFDLMCGTWAIIITTFDNDSSHVIVVIDKSQ